MKIYKDILEHLKLESIHVRMKGENYFGVPLEMEANNWVLALDGKEEIQGEGILCVRRGNDIYEWPVYLTKIINNEAYSIYSCIHKCVININQLTDKDMELLDEIRNVEKQTERWNKRKEERFVIKEDIEGIGFDSAEQQIITIDDTLPCFINNVSYSGSQVVTVCSYMPKGKVICLNLGFKNPTERIPIKATVRHYEELKNTNDKLAVVSMEFDHAPLAWQQRMNRLIESINNKKNEEK